jgi:colanic acid/amylovoran biosynthesis glycosyltransferase
MSPGRSSPRLVLLAPSFPKLSETFIASKFVGLLGGGWDVHVACGQLNRAAWKDVGLPEITTGLRRRVHASWPVRPRWLAVLLTPVALLACLTCAPRQTARYLRGGWRRFGLDVLRRLYLDAELIRLRPDLIHFEFGSLAPERMYLKELLNCRVVVSFRGYDLNYVGLDQPGYYQPVWDGADALHLLGEDLWQRAQRRGCPADKRHVLIPPAIDVNVFTPNKQHNRDYAGRPLRILSVGRLDWRKGYEYSLQAIRMLFDQGVPCEYHLLGGGEYLEALSFARHQLGLDGEVELLGAQPHQVVRTQMAWADVFLHAAVSEGFCNAVIEAQAMSLPVVCSDAGGLPENVADGVTGFVVPRRNPRALADKLAQLAGDPGLRQRMGQAGRERVLRCFRLDDQIAAFEQLYREVLS